MLKFRIPLYGRIAGWFLLNLILVGIVLYFFTRALLPEKGQLSASAAQRVDTLASLVAEKLQRLDETEWTKELSTLELQHGFEFHPYTLRGQLPRGMDLKTPRDVLAELDKFTTPRTKTLTKPRTRPSNRSPNTRPNNQKKQSERSTEPLAPREFPDGLQNIKVQSLSSYKDTRNNHWFLAQVSLGPPEKRFQRRPNALLLLMKASPESAKHMTFNSLPWWLLILGILALCLFMWVPFTWGLTRYISQLTATTETIARGNFQIRNSSARGDELGRLGEAINHLAHRLEGFVNGQRRFMSDIAHELCGPLVRMQLSLGVIEASPEKTAQKLEGLRREIEEMNTMVEELLDFSRASISPDKVEIEPIYLFEVAESVFTKECTPSPINNIPPELTVRCNRHLLTRAISNVVRNSMRYAGHDSQISLSTELSEQKVILHIDDQGPGIEASHLNKVFDPFYRVDEARTREDGGTGLGLAIVQTCVKACLGEVSCHNLSPHGLRVTMTLLRGNLKDEELQR